MGSTTGIEWTDATWNPIRGCTRVSEGCRHCYAETQALRFSGPGQPYAGLVKLKNGHPSWTGKIQFVEKHLLDPLRWRTTASDDRGAVTGLPARRRRIFVNSMSDLFHEGVTDEMRDKIFAVMALCPQHTFQVLTKRPLRMLQYMTEACTEQGGLRIGRAAAGLFHGMSLRDRHLSMAEQAAVSNRFEWQELKHVQLGVSVENQAAADERIPLLLRTPAAVRFVSCEPLLGPTGLGQWLGTECRHEDSQSEPDTNATICKECDESALLDWVICGGESGPGARPMHPEWARGLRDQCAAAGVPFFFKQWGEWLPMRQANELQGSSNFSAHGLVYRDGEDSIWAGPDRQDPETGLRTRGLDGNIEHNCTILDDAAVVYRLGRKAAGALLDGREWKQFPEARG